MSDSESLKPVEVQPVNVQEMEVSMSGPAVYVNKFIISISPAGTRIAFAEQGPDMPPVFRSAVLLNLADSFALAGLLKQLLDQNVTVVQTPAHQPSPVATKA